MDVLIGNRQVYLSDLLDSGGQASIYVNPKDKSKVIKIYNSDTMFEEGRVKYLISHPPSQMFEKGISVFAWPEEVVYDARTGEPCGFTMKRMLRSLLLHQIVTPNVRPRGVSRAFLYRVAISFLKRFHTLHLVPYIIGDINLYNLMVSRSAIVSQIDVDSMHFAVPNGPTYTTYLHRPEFQPPELNGAVLPVLDRDQDQDAWSAAIVLHRLLREGVHPFDCQFVGTGNPPMLNEMIQKGIWPDSLRHPECQPKPSPVAFSDLPADLQRLFRQMFQDGHSDRNARPTVTDFLTCMIQHKPLWLAGRVGRAAWRRELSRQLSSAPLRPQTNRLLSRHKKKVAATLVATIGLATYSSHVKFKDEKDHLSTYPLSISPPLDSNSSQDKQQLPPSRQPAVEGVQVLSKPEPRLWREAANIKQ